MMWRGSEEDLSVRIRSGRNFGMKRGEGCDERRDNQPACSFLHVRSRLGTLIAGITQGI